MKYELPQRRFCCDWCGARSESPVLAGLTVGGVPIICDTCPKDWLTVRASWNRCQRGLLAELRIKELQDGSTWHEPNTIVDSELHYCPQCRETVEALLADSPHRELVLKLWAPWAKESPEPERAPSSVLAVLATFRAALLAIANEAECSTPERLRDIARDALGVLVPVEPDAVSEPCPHCGTTRLVDNGLCISCGKPNPNPRH